MKKYGKKQNYKVTYENFTFIGYDYGEISGWYDEDLTEQLYFSIIANEVNIFGFKNFISKLNKYYLFNDIKDVIELDKERVKVFNNANDIKMISFEPGIYPEDCNIYHIYMYNKDLVLKQHLNK